MTTPRAAALIVFLITMPAPSTGQVIDSAPLTLAELETLAIAKHPAITAAKGRIDAARGRATQAGLPPNPTIGYTLEEVSGEPITQSGEQGIFIEQTIPLGGKLRLSRQIGEHAVSAVEADAEAERLRVLTAVRIRFYEALAAQARVETRDRLARLASEAVGVSRRLFNVGSADQPDMLEAEIEAQQADLDLVEARNALALAWQRMAASVGDSGLAPRRLAGDLAVGLPDLQREEMLARVLGQSPEVTRARADLARSQAASTRASREKVPDLVLRGGPRYNFERLESGASGPRGVGWELALDVGLTIPLFNRNQGNVAASRADIGRTQEELRRLDLELRERFSSAFDEYLTARRAAEVYRKDILPRAEQAYKLYLARYQQMAAAYPQVLVAQRTLFQANDRYITSVERAWRAALRLEGLLVADRGLTLQGDSQ
jgi:outer membrane protein, heavy metal efflux system